MAGREVVLWCCIECSPGRWFVRAACSMAHVPQNAAFRPVQPQPIPQSQQLREEGDLLLYILITLIQRPVLGQSVITLLLRESLKLKMKEARQ